MKTGSAMHLSGSHFAQQAKHARRRNSLDLQAASTDSRPPAGSGTECTVSFLLLHKHSPIRKDRKAKQDGEDDRDVRYLHTLSFNNL